jgi:hypothetical protein
MTWQKTTNHDGLDHRWNRRGTVKAWLTRFPCTAATFRDHPCSAARRAWWLVRARAWCCRRQVDQWMTCSMRWTGAMAAVRRRRISLRVNRISPAVSLGAGSGTIEESFAASKELAALDEHQVRTWTSWHRWPALAILAHAFLSIMAANGQSWAPRSPEGHPVPPTSEKDLRYGLRPALGLLASTQPRSSSGGRTSFWSDTHAT